MSDKRLHQIGFAAALLSALCWFVYIYGQTSLPNLSNVDDAGQYFQTVQDNRMSYLLYGWSGVFGTLLLLPYLFAFYQALKAKRPIALLGLFIASVGASLALIGFTKPLMLVYYFTPQGLAASPETVEMVKIAGEIAGNVVEISWNFGSFLIFGLGVGLFALHALRTSTGAAWINIVGIVGGLAGLVWLGNYAPIFEPLTTPLILTNILGIIVWSIALSAVLLRRDEAIEKQNPKFSAA